MAAAFGAQLAQALQNQEFTKLPYWYNDPKYDTFKAEDWWSRFEFAAEQGQWNWERTKGNFMNCMRGIAVKWYKSLERFNPPQNRAALREKFLADYAATPNNRASIADVKIQQGNDSVINFWTKLHAVYDEIELTVPAVVVPDTQAACLTICAGADGGAAQVNALNLQNLQNDYRRVEALGYRRGMAPLFRAYFIAGLNQKIQDEVLRQNPVTPEDALEVAKRAEKDFLLKEKGLTIQEVDEEDEEDYEVDAIRRRQGKSFRGRARGQRGTRSATTRPGNLDKTNSMCFYCNKKGHWQRECRKRLSENGKTKAKTVHEVDQEDSLKPLINALHELHANEQPATASENW